MCYLHACKYITTDQQALELLAARAPRLRRQRVRPWVLSLCPGSALTLACRPSTWTLPLPSNDMLLRLSVPPDVLIGRELWGCSTQLPVQTNVRRLQSKSQWARGR